FKLHNNLTEIGLGVLWYGWHNCWLSLQVRGSHVGTYLPSSGVWRHIQRALKKGVSKPKTVHHLDFDAPTCEHAEQLPDDKKQDESLLEDVWTLLRAGRLEEACDLCRSAGQPWRAATLCPFGGLDLCPSVEALVKNGNNRTLQAIELESGIGHQWRLWKWATYCVSESKMVGNMKQQYMQPSVVT
ncbi:nuclear pore complex protein NUP107-like, partial [Camellia sinensis]|uniref:nuclear pore complex protein NUP107-like n=1 Tax=Camellia sinensis TaxID=4442 RepID=UPI00103569FB